MANGRVFVDDEGALGMDHPRRVAFFAKLAERGLAEPIPYDVYLAIKEELDPLPPEQGGRGRPRGPRIDPPGQP